MRLHQWLKDMRDKNISHSVSAYEDFSVGVVISPENSDNNGVVGVAVLTHQFLGWLENAEGRERLARKISALFERELETTKKAVLEQARRLPVTKLLKKPPLGQRIPGPEKANRTRKGPKHV